MSRKDDVLMSNFTWKCLAGYIFLALGRTFAQESLMIFLRKLKDN